MNQKLSKFYYEDNSNKLFSKLTLVNTLSLKEIDRLNDIYIRNGLYIKQIQVDSYGNELISNKNISLLNKKERKKRAMMTLKEFYNKYYYLSDFTRNKKNKKYLQKKKKRAKSDVINESLDYSEESSIDEEYLQNLRKNLNDLYHDIQNMEYKDCKITDMTFKQKIVEYVVRFKDFLSDNQYNILFRKWKNEHIKIKGVNPLDSDSVNDLSNWKTSILKGFKSELVLLAMSNILGKKIGEEDEGENEENKVEEKKKEDDSEQSEQNSDSLSDVDSNIYGNKDENKNIIDDRDIKDNFGKNVISRKIIEDM